MSQRYDLNKNKQETYYQPVSVRDIHLASFDATWHSTAHSHPFTELFYCLSGEGKLWTEHKELPVQKQSLVLINPHVKHTEYSSPEAPLHYMVMSIDGIISTTEGELYPHYFHQDYDHVIHPLMKQIIKEVQTDSAYSPATIHHLVNLVILRLHQNNQQMMITNPNDSHLTLPIYTIKTYLDTHYSLDIHLDMLEEKVHLSKYHLAYRFKKETGLTIMEYLNQLRIRQAQELLRTTNYSISQIASLVGFNSASYFSTTFKQETQQTPSQYRQTMMES